MIRIAGYIFLFAFTISSCSPRWSERLATPGDVKLYISPDENHTPLKNCYNPLTYVEHPGLMRLKYVRVNLHFINSSDGRYNMPESEAPQFAKDWIYAVNDNLKKNMKMFLPHGNETPALPIPYRYVITGDPSIPGDEGVYYHIDDTLCYAVKSGRDRNISDKRMIHKYAVRPDSVLNIFLQSHHLDSIHSRTYSPGTSGISLGSSVKMFGKWQEKPNVWDIRGILNHEIGHSLGLSHTWGGQDGCDDTPPHPNCWNKTDKPPCDSILSNNMMDYNAHMAALTPCQIGKILMNMGRLGSIQRNILQPRWCQLDTSATITVSDSTRWSASVDLEGSVVLENGAVLEIGCRISLPEGATIRIAPGAKLIIFSSGRLHNACGDEWGGIILEKEKKVSGELWLMEGGRLENIPQFPAARS